MVLKVFIESSNFSFFIIAGWGIDLDYHDIEWFTLEMNKDHSVIFETASEPSTAFQTLLLTMMASPFFSKGFLPTGVDIMVI